ncbi:hypothetical protein ACKFKG_22910 [Phormidesmis sp. 146-35]
MTQRPQACSDFKRHWSVHHTAGQNCHLVGGCTSPLRSPFWTQFETAKCLPKIFTQVCPPAVRCEMCGGLLVATSA